MTFKTSVGNHRHTYSTIASPAPPTVPTGNCVPCPFKATAPALTPLVVIVYEARSLQLCPPLNIAAEELPRNRKAPEGSQAAACGEPAIGTAAAICDSAPPDGSTAKASTLL